MSQTTSQRSRLVGDEVSVHDIDTGRRCKVVLKKGVDGITVAKLKSNLEGHFGVPARDQVLTISGEELRNSNRGREAGLYPGCSVDLRRVGSMSLKENSAEHYHHHHHHHHHHHQHHQDHDYHHHHQEHHQHHHHPQDHHQDHYQGNFVHSEIDERPVSVQSATHSHHSIEDYRYCSCRNCHLKPKQSEPPAAHKVLFKQNKTCFQQSDYTQRDKELEKLNHLQSAYTDLVKKQQWVLEGDSFNGGQAGLMSQAAAYKAGTHPHGLGVAHMRRTY